MSDQAPFLGGPGNLTLMWGLQKFGKLCNKLSAKETKCAG